MTILSRSRRRGPALLVAAAMVGSAFVLTAAAKPSDAVAGRQIGRHHVVPAPAQLGLDPVPVPADVTGAVDERECGHAAVSLSGV